MNKTHNSLTVGRYSETLLIWRKQTNTTEKQLAKIQGIQNC
jgi:hypothetical protein